MKYINDVLALAGLLLVAYGVYHLWGEAVCALTMGVICLVLALFKPLIQIFRGDQHAFIENSDAEGDQ